MPHATISSFSRSSSSSVDSGRRNVQSRALGRSTCAGVLAFMRWTERDLMLPRVTVHEFAKDEPDITARTWEVLT